MLSCLCVFTCLHGMCAVPDTPMWLTVRCVRSAHECVCVGLCVCVCDVIRAQDRVYASPAPLTPRGNRTSETGKVEGE